MKRQAFAWPCLLFCNEFIRAALYYVWVPLVLSHRFHMPIWWVGFCTSCQFITDAAMKFFFGSAAARGFAGWMIRGGSVVAGISVLVLLFAQDEVLLLVFSVLYGGGAASVWPAALSYYARRTGGPKAELIAQALLPGWRAQASECFFLM